MQQSEPCGLISCYSYMANWAIYLSPRDEKVIQTLLAHVVLISANYHWKLGCIIVLFATDWTLELNLLPNQASRVYKPYSLHNYI